MVSIQTWGYCLRISVGIQLKLLFFKVQRRVNLRIGENFPAPSFGRWMKHMILLISVIRHTQLLISYIVLTDGIIRKQ